jgi:glycosyltransferase involved in cell wall biosynthesis
MLIVKVSNIEHDRVLQEKLQNITSAHKNIKVIAEYVSDAAIIALYEECDAYVSLHRAEGFGLTISDAMSRGIPVITTGYSGNMEFCEPFDTNLVSYTLENIGHERLRYRSDDIWAEPNMDCAVQAFREMVTYYNKKIKMAEDARNRIVKEFSVKKISDLMLERIKLIHSGFNYSNDLDGRKLDLKVETYNTYGF